MKGIVILGSTGSIGRQALDVVRHNRELFSVEGLCCCSNTDMLEGQLREFDVKWAAVFDERKARELRGRVKADVLSGIEGIMALTALDSADLVLNSLVGSIGIRPTVSAIQNKKDVALANKETLVAAGDIVMDLVKRNGVSLYPVDSEHSAIFQCIGGEQKEGVRRLILTCSGGAFRDKTREEMKHLRSADALQHPNWNMGEKITVDSATLMNKGLEVIEARMLFDIGYDDIDVVIHPQSIIHSMVEFVDGSVLAQMSSPDMRLPIQYALTWPERRENPCPTLDLSDVGSLSFEQPDTDRFPCLAHAYEAGRAGGTMPCVLNAANEIAVSAFLRGIIGFHDIPAIVQAKMKSHIPVMNPCLEEILAIDEETKREISRELNFEGACYGAAC